MWYNESCELETSTLYFICPCVDLWAAIYVHQLRRELISRHFFANGWNTLLLISCWGFKVRLEHLSTHTPIGRTRSHSLKLLKPFIDKMILMAIRRVRPWYRDRITLESRMWNLHLVLIHFAHVWICAWAVQLKLQETHSVTRSLFANRCYSHLLMDLLFFQKGWASGF